MAAPPEVGSLINAIRHSADNPKTKRLFRFASEKVSVVDNLASEKVSAVDNIASEKVSVVDNLASEMVSVVGNLLSCCLVFFSIKITLLKHKRLVLYPYRKYSDAFLHFPFLS